MEIRGGILPQPNGSPITPGSNWAGPLTAGPIPQSMANMGAAPAPGGLGGSSGLADSGYCVMGQSAVVTQAAGAAPTVIVLPPQSQILEMTLMVTTAWNGAATTVSVGHTGGGAADLVALTSAAALGQLALNPGAVPAAIALWDNVGNSQLQVTVTSANAGAGVGTLTVTYLQGINMAS